MIITLVCATHLSIGGDTIPRGWTTYPPVLQELLEMARKHDKVPTGMLPASEFSAVIWVLFLVVQYTVCHIHRAHIPARIRDFSHNKIGLFPNVSRQPDLFPCGTECAQPAAISTALSVSE